MEIDAFDKNNEDELLTFVFLCAALIIVVEEFEFRHVDCTHVPTLLY